MDIIAMHHSGLSVRNISRALGIHRKTVKKHIEADAFPQYHKRKRGIASLSHTNRSSTTIWIRMTTRGHGFLIDSSKADTPAVTTLSSITLPISKSRRPGWRISALRRSRDYKPRLTGVIFRFRNQTGERLQFMPLRWSLVIPAICTLSLWSAAHWISSWIVISGHFLIFVVSPLRFSTII